MMQDFAGKVALVVGSGSGIGQAAAQIFGARGARVVVATLEVDGGNETVDLIRAVGGEAVFHQVDATSEAAVRGMVEFTVGHYGRLDAAFNNVGHPGPAGETTQVALADFEHCLLLNTISCFLAMKYEIAEMLKVDGGAIVNTASLAGLIGNPHQVAYAAAKHAVIGMTKTAALEFAKRNVRVNALCPGGTDTPMLRASAEKWNAYETGAIKTWYEPMGRLATAREQGETAVWLCSEAASFITGHAVPVDGGHMAGNRMPD